jgi:SAM-dependent methyltransferase
MSQRSVIVSVRDRYGAPVETALCMDCGLFYIVGRFTPDSYAQFYASGGYRRVCSQFNGVEYDVDQIQSDQAGYAQTLVKALAGYVANCRNGRLLDIGGSTGIIARGFVDEFGMRATILDPAEHEVAAAKASGMNAIAGVIEKWDRPEKYDLVLLCRSIEHLTDLRGALRKIRGLLKPDGFFYCDISDFMELCRLVGPPETFTKIDHCYWLTHSTAPGIFRMLGFDLFSTYKAFDSDCVGYLLRPCEPVPLSPPFGRTADQVAEIYRTRQEWIELGKKRIPPSQWARGKAYRMKRMFQRSMAAVRGAFSDEPAVVRRQSAPGRINPAIPHSRGEFGVSLACL